MFSLLTMIKYKEKKYLQVINKANRGTQSAYLTIRWEMPFVRYMTGNVFSYNFPKDVMVFCVSVCDATSV